MKGSCSFPCVPFSTRLTTPSAGGIVPPHLEWRFTGTTVDFPCFIYKIGERAELLWGVTFRIVTVFLEMLFGFQVPDIEKLPLVPASVTEEYVIGRTRNGARQNNLSFMAPDH